MKTFLAIFVLLFSSSVFSKVGDIYSCEADKVVKVTQNIVQEFKMSFKILRKSDEIVISNYDFFDNTIVKVDWQAKDEIFIGSDENLVFAYIEGTFQYSYLFPIKTETDQPMIISIFARCNID